VKRSCTHICLQGATQHIALTAALKLDFGHLRTGKKNNRKKKERKTHRMGPVEKCNWQTVETEKLQREWFGPGQAKWPPSPKGKKGKAIENTSLVICSERLLFCAPFSFHFVFGQLWRQGYRLLLLLLATSFLASLTTDRLLIECVFRVCPKDAAFQPFQSNASFPFSIDLL